MNLNKSEEDTIRILRRIPIGDMFDEMVKLMPHNIWSDDGTFLLPSAILRLYELGWTQEEFYIALGNS